MILIEDVLPNGLPRPDSTAQQTREYHAGGFLTDPGGPTAESMRQHSKLSLTVRQAMVITGKKLAHAALTRRLATKSETRTCPLHYGL